ncbi:hypothetical protein [Arthrobacter sp. NPDC090010]|uniref:hypothetical protein n=1 Tax=Arthrobacter sp. NPDC090010 TaxID=3363942 RepID=UPI00381504A0
MSETEPNRHAVTPGREAAARHLRPASLNRGSMDRGSTDHAAESGTAGVPPQPASLQMASARGATISRKGQHKVALAAFAFSAAMPVALGTSLVLWG